MPDSPSGRSQREQQLDAIIAEYYEAAEQGQPHQAEFLSRHPDFAVELREFFVDMGRLREVARPLKSTQSGTVASVGLKIRDYRVLEKIGAGGMGTVYLALHMRLEKTVALKILKADRERNPQSIARFEREMKAVGKLEHPHIVRALDAGEEAGTHFLAMEYIAGCDLARLLKSKGRLEVPLACELIRQAALGLQHAHDHHLVHRDVKPSNLILSVSGQVKVLDLGLAQLQANADDSHELTREGQFVGTWLYMAPEQFLPGRQVDSRSDIYSLGVTFYSFLVGDLPLSRGQSATHLPAIGTQRGDVPPDVQALLSRMLASQQDQRIQSMTEVARVLEDYAAQGSVNILASSAVKNSVVVGTPPSQVGTQSWSSTADEPDVVPPPVVVPPPTELPTVMTQNPPLRPWSHFAVAGAGILTLLVLLLGEVTNWGDGWSRSKEAGKTHSLVTPLVEVPKVIYGTIEVTIPEPDDQEDEDKKLAEDFINEIVNQETLYLIDLATNTRITLGMGMNGKIPVGSYELKSDDVDLQLPPSSSRLDVTEKSNLQLPLRLSPPSAAINARLPDYEGAFCSYTGVLQHSGLPAGKAVAYDLALRMLGTEDFAGVPCRWLEVEVANRAVNYVETAWLLVDTRRYQEEKKLYVQRGWITAESKTLQQRLRLFPGASVQRLAAEFDPNGDSLGDLARRLNIQLPPNRIPVNEALVLLFNAQVSAHETIVTARAILAAPGRDSSRKRVMVPGQGEHRGWTVSSGATYEIQGASDFPFLFANVSINAPPRLTASCSLTTFRKSVAKPAPDFELLQTIAGKLATLPNPPVTFDVASIPAQGNVQATFTGTIQMGLKSRSFSTSIRTAGFSSEKGRDYCWLEIDLKSGPEKNLDAESASQETAWILVRQDWDQEDGFRIEQGWLLVAGETFPFDVDGNVVPVEEALFKLKLDKGLDPFRLRVQQVLSLLFDAKLEGAGNLTRIRKDVEQALRKADKSRVHSEVEIDPDGLGLKTIPGDAWKIPKEAKVGFTSAIVRSKLLPFDFYSVDFDSPALTIHTTRKYLEAVPAAPPFDEAARRKWGAVTRKKINDLAPGAADDENQRIWRDQNGKIVFWGEFGLLQNKKVVLKSAEGKPPQAYVIKDLSELDQAWIERGRHWRDTDGKPLWPDLPDSRAHYVSTNTNSDKVNLRRSGMVKSMPAVSMTDLDKRDQEWLRWRYKFK